MSTFNPHRLQVAQMRRRMKGGDLAKASGVSEITVSRIAHAKNIPDEGTVELLAKALCYPTRFFYQDGIEVLTRNEVSFRSLARMPAADRNAAIAAGSLGMLLCEWIDERFNLPAVDVPDFRESTPEQAAVLLRQHWKLGEKPISNMLKLMESKGVRVLSLFEHSRNVDAFSFWRGDSAFMFLNTFKTPEHSIFDSGHELGHLVLHRHSEISASKQAEAEANRFASAFLMPERDVLANCPRRITTDSIIKFKKRWRVSAMAFAYRLNALGRLTEWQYRSICIELSSRGYRTSEPDGVERESSVVLSRVFEQLWSDKVTKLEVANELCIPLDELEALVFDLIGTKQIDRPPRVSGSNLRLVK